MAASGNHASARNGLRGHLAAKVANVAPDHLVVKVASVRSALAEAARVAADRPRVVVGPMVGIAGPGLAVVLGGPHSEGAPVAVLRVATAARQVLSGDRYNQEA